jgi:hypothetical protein
MENALLYVLGEELSAVHYRAPDGCDSLGFSLLFCQSSLSLVGLGAAVEGIPLK